MSDILPFLFAVFLTVGMVLLCIVVGLFGYAVIKEVLAE